MKARPRHAENEVARIFTEIFARAEHSPVERIPTTGRTGPDISINEVGLVIDVKSRLEVPKGIFRDHPFTFDGYYAVPLSMFPTLEAVEQSTFASVIISHYFDHMHEWTMLKRKTGITALVLHRPKMPYGKAMLIINYSNMEELCKRMNLLFLVHNCFS